MEQNTHARLAKEIRSKARRVQKAEGNISIQFMCIGCMKDPQKKCLMCSILQSAVNYLS